MLISLYMLFIGIVFSLIVLSLLKENLLITWLVVVLSFVLAITSYNVQTPFCEVVDPATQTWSCYLLIVDDTKNLSYLFYGLGALFLVYGIIQTISSVAPRV